jgi:hypothetical protein
MTSSGRHIAIFVLCVAAPGTLLVCAVALFYLRRVRLERPAIGTFNGRDIVVLFCFLSTIPLFYLTLPRWLLTGFLALTFIASLSIGYRPVLRSSWLWLGIGVLLGLNIWLGNNFLGTVHGWQMFWAENDLVVLLGAVSVANLYIQGGMKLRHVAWFSLVLGGYDLFFTTVYPVTDALVEKFLGYPLDPAIGMRWGFDNATVGLGDLLVYALFVLAAFKAYGRKAGRIAMSLVVLFGAVVPAMVPLLINFIDARADTLVPAQTWFGPAAFIVYRWLRKRYGRERTMKEFLDSDDVVRPRPAPAAPDAADPVAAPEFDPLTPAM